jgi:hypothetical protein
MALQSTLINTHFFPHFLNMTTAHSWLAVVAAALLTLDAVAGSKTEAHFLRIPLELDQTGETFLASVSIGGP